MTNVEELQRALDYPWDKWTIFLHPEQRQWVERDYSGRPVSLVQRAQARPSSRCTGLPTWRKRIPTPACC